MIDFDKTLGFYQSALRGVVERQRVTAHNIANQNTPGYRAKTVDFRETLARALEQSDDVRGLRFSVEEARGLPVKANGNNVDLEHEWMQMEENRLLHEIFARAAGGTFQGLLRAIRSR